jgi:hypothetical protein
MREEQEVMQTTMRFMFDQSVPLREARETLKLAQMAVESLHGRERVEFEAPVAIDGIARMFEFDVSRRTGRTLALIFSGYVRREFGPEAVRVEHWCERPAIPAGAAR